MIFRDRRRFRHPLLVLLVLALLALGTWLAFRTHAQRRLEAAMTAVEERLGPTDPAAYELPPVPDEENAFVLLEPGLEAVGEADFETRELWKTLFQEPPRRWPPEEEVAAALAKSAPALEALHAVAGARRSSRGARFPEAFEDSPSLLPYLTAARLLAAHARWSLVHGDPQAALASARTLAALAGALEREPPLIDKLIGAATEKLLHRIAATAIAERSPREAIRELRELLLGLPPEVGFPRAVGLDATWVAGYALELDPDLYRWWKRPSRDLCLARVLDGYAELASSDRPYAAVLDEAEAELKAHPPGVGLRNRLCPSAEMSIPNILEAGLKIHAAEAARSLAVMALELDLRARSLGAYPPTVVGLTGADRADALGGEAPVWTLRADGSGELVYPAARATTERRGEYRAGTPPHLAWELPAPASGALATAGD